MTPNVVDILVLLKKYRYLRSTFIYKFLPARNLDGCSRTLRRMFDAHLIQKPSSQWFGYSQKEDADIYEIDRRGLEALKRAELRPHEVTTLSRKRHDGITRQFDHSMMICDTLASIELGHIEAGLEFIPWGAIRERSVGAHPLRLPCKVKLKPTYAVPDGIYGTRLADGKVWFYALEAENYSPVVVEDLSRSSFLKKLLSYNHIAKHKPYVEQLGIPNLRYLFVTPTDARTNNLISVVNEHCSIQPSMPVYNRIFVRTIPVQYELMRAPQPFADLFTDPWETPAGAKHINQ